MLPASGSFSFALLLYCDRTFKYSSCSCQRSQGTLLFDFSLLPPLLESKRTLNGMIEGFAWEEVGDIFNNRPPAVGYTNKPLQPPSCHGAQGTIGVVIGRRSVSGGVVLCAGLSPA